MPDNVRTFSIIPPCVMSGGGLSIKGCKIDLIWPKLRNDIDHLIIGKSPFSLRAKLKKTGSTRNSKKTEVHK